MVRVLRVLFMIPNILLVYKELLGSLEPTEFCPSEFAGTMTARERRGDIIRGTQVSNATKNAIQVSSE